VFQEEIIVHQNIYLCFRILLCVSRRNNCASEYLFVLQNIYLCLRILLCASKTFICASEYLFVLLYFDLCLTLMGHRRKVVSWHYQIQIIWCIIGKTHRQISQMWLAKLLTRISKNVSKNNCHVINSVFVIPWSSRHITICDRFSEWSQIAGAIASEFYTSLYLAIHGTLGEFGSDFD